MTLVMAIITLLYLGLLAFLLYGYHRQPAFSGKPMPPATSFSIVIPFRNEAKNLPNLLDSLVKLEYPISCYEIILVNDFSEDESEAICLEALEKYPQLNLHVLRNTRTSGSPKKGAITTGIEKARGVYILTTDGDCMVPTTWLQVFNSYILKKKCFFIAGPVRSISEKGMWKAFEEMDNFSLQTASIGGFGLRRPFLCNGANLCYQKAAFLQLGGFEGNDHIASGDDIFLLEKFRAAKYVTGYLKHAHAAVFTRLQDDLAGLVSQRVRWAAKATAYQALLPRLLGLVVLLMNAMLLITAMACLWGLSSYQALLWPFLLKFVLDFIFIYISAAFYKREQVLMNYVWCSLTYPFFSSYVALFSLFKGYTWKGRRFRR